MNWKVFLTAFASALLIALPQNVYTCAGGEDPYDYYTSFFSNTVGTNETYQPFYYTALLTFYDDWSQDSVDYTNGDVVQEWEEFFNATEADIVQLIYKSTPDELLQLKEGIKRKSVPAKWTNNVAVKTMFKSNDEAVINYLSFAKKTESIASSDAWTDRKKDSLGLNKFINEATGEFTKATDLFIKTKWAFQRCKLTFYNNRFADCIRWYDEYFTESNNASVAALALSYKGGSQYRLGKNKEAAYTFSKAFPLSNENKKSNFLGFLWATKNCNSELVQEYTEACKNNVEKANMLALFAMHGTEYRLPSLQSVYQLYPSSPLLPLLVSREINKLEEQYLTPLLAKQKGGRALNSYWTWRATEANDKPLNTEPVFNAASFFEKLLNDKVISNRGLYGAGAAYLHFITGNYAKAKTLSASVKEITSDAKVKDQLSLINLLIMANEAKTITPAIETQMLPSIKWLTDKAKKDKEYALFCRNFFSEIVAQKYEQQADIPKAALAYGMADLPFTSLPENEYIYSYSSAIDFVRTNISTTDLLKLYETTTSPKTEIEKFFVQNSSVKRDAVVDVIGTSYLRDRNYSKAIEWLSKAAKLEPLVEAQYNYTTNKETSFNVDPLHDYLNDWQRFTKSATQPYTKLTLAKKLAELEAKAGQSSDMNVISKTYYQLASALYNMSYYGNSWNAVAYDRSGVDWNEGNYEQPWEKEYYGVYKAREYYEKAYALTSDKEFKAACLFMAAKCAQRQIPRPPYNYNNYEQYEKALAAFEIKFKNNPLFSKFKTEFGDTKFYQYTYNRCSYLRDYVKKSGTPTKAPLKPKSKS